MAIFHLTGSLFLGPILNNCRILQKQFIYCHDDDDEDEDDSNNSEDNDLVFKLNRSHGEVLKFLLLDV